MSQLHWLWIFVSSWTESDQIVLVSFSDSGSTSIQTHCMINTWHKVKVCTELAWQLFNDIRHISCSATAATHHWLNSMMKMWWCVASDMKSCAHIVDIYTQDFSSHQSHTLFFSSQISQQLKIQSTEHQNWCCSNVAWNWSLCFIHSLLFSFMTEFKQWSIS